MYFSKQVVDQIFAAGGSFVGGDDKNYSISAGKRTAPGEAEIHGRDTDIFFVIDGTATIVTGALSFTKRRSDQTRSAARPSQAAHPRS